MKSIQTVLGEVQAKDVKRICIHEHLLMDMTHEAIEPRTEEEKRIFYGDIRMDNLGLLRRNPYVVRTNLMLDSIEDAVEEVKPLMDCGCNLLLDLTSVGLSRDVRGLKTISEKTGLNVACGCGLFVHDSRVEAYRDWSVERLTEWMLKEINEGIEDTGIRPAVIGEIGTSEKIYPIEERSLLAAANASVESGLPVYVHTYPWSRAGLDAVDMLMKNGVKPEKICLCHLDVDFDEEYMLMALDRGVYVEFDNLSKEYCFEPSDGAFAGGPFETDWARVDMMKKLIERGYVSRLLAADDVCLKASLRKYGGWGYDHMFTNFIPMMRMGGVAEGDIIRIFDENPRIFLFGENKN